MYILSKMLKPARGIPSNFIDILIKYVYYTNQLYEYPTGLYKGFLNLLLIEPRPYKLYILLKIW